MFSIFFFINTLVSSCVYYNCSKRLSIIIRVPYHKLTELLPGTMFKLNIAIACIMTPRALTINNTFPINGKNAQRQTSAIIYC